MKRLAFISAALLLLSAGLATWLWRRDAPPMAPPAPLREVQPKATAVLPTLDTPIPKGKSALWCASFQLAWERLKTDVANGPVRLDGVEASEVRLNDAASVTDAVNSEDVYATAGLARDGIVGEIRREMARRFPGEAVDLGDAADGAVAYAYFRASVRFAHPFIENAEPLTFAAADRTQHSVRSFGLPYRISRRRSVAEQVAILHAKRGERGVDTYVLDPSKNTSPYQVLIAKIPRQLTLAEMLADVERRIAGPNDDERIRPLDHRDAMLIPHLRFQITHHFKELEGRRTSARGWVLVRAMQRIAFRLDASGALLTSTSRLDGKNESPRGFITDGPFLVLMRKRGSTQPFFVLWVENAELLEAW